MSLFSAIGVSATGMSVQRVRAEVITQNLANSETTRTPEGGPYRRRDVVFEATIAGGQFGTVLQDQMGQGLTGVQISEIRVDQEKAPQRYLPGHPDADKDGYVSMPRVNPAEDMVDLMSASRGYQANIAAVSAVKDMIQRSIELFR
ncbi:MAG: flagellar basal body rod protein FlgC [Bryobacteraceae bacterium]|nr:flagellar basal body rod protein FlgC [Bryobacteraceae bacterium]